MKKELRKPTESELEILQTLWQKGPSTVKQVHDDLKKVKEVGYTTTLKLMQIMFEKGLLKREKSGKTHTYTPIVSEEKTKSQLIAKLRDSAFGGSAMKLVMQALGNQNASKDEIMEIKEYLDKIEKGLK
jgi:predicted transcriptional regulator